VQDLADHTEDLLNAFLQHPELGEATLKWANRTVSMNHAKMLKNISNKDSGWHFNASRISGDRLSRFELDDMARRMQRLAPDLWGMLDVLFAVNQPGAVEMDQDIDEEEFLLNGVDLDEHGTIPKPANLQQAEKRRKLLTTIVSLTKGDLTVTYTILQPEKGCDRQYNGVQYQPKV
jgi:hypothetical protein